jgi:16S rRNA (cytosine1402-N4)-methyltransferase
VTAQHISVMPAEIVAGLQPRPGQTIVDATVGGGGHTKLLAEAVAPNGRVIGLDQDPTMLDLARPRLAGLPVELVYANFEDLPEVLQKLQLGPVDALLADLGFCSDQIANSERGFSFQHDGPLDMRLDPTRGEPASAMVQRLREKDLADVIFRYGEERQSRRIAHRIVEARKETPIATTGQLAEIVRRSMPRSGGIDPATRTFQALRIAVNDELGALERLLAAISHCVRPGGRVALISFHSLEDRLVKEAFRDAGRFEIVTRKPLTASDAEVAANPRARSAKLRVAIRRP